jgi:hypothetical protein
MSYQETGKVEAKLHTHGAQTLLRNYLHPIRGGHTRADWTPFWKADELSFLQTRPKLMRIWGMERWFSLYEGGKKGVK